MDIAKRTSAVCSNNSTPAKPLQLRHNNSSSCLLHQAQLSTPQPSQPPPLSSSSSVMNNVSSNNNLVNTTNIDNNVDSPNHNYIKPQSQMCPAVPFRQNKCFSAFLNDMFANSQSPGPSSSLAASTSITGFSTSSCASSNFAFNGEFGANQHVNYAQFAPLRSQWYHGRLERKVSETRLINSSLSSAYLIRESDRKPGSYVLSFYGRTGINHFRITAICGDYYFGGKQFKSLEDLVGFYTECSDLLSNERLVNPVSPPEPIRIESQRVVAILPYTKMHETDELSFRKGDIFVVHNEMSDRWLWCTNIRNQESGLVFADLVERVDDDTDPNEVYGWFYSRISQEEAFEKLSRSGPGSFLVRPSDNSPGDYSIFFYVDNSVQRFRVERRQDKYVMGGRVFPTLETVINRYKEEQIVEGHRLLKPVIKAPYETRWTTSRAEELRAAAADIYATIRECREMAQSNQEVKMKGYLFKKSKFYAYLILVFWKKLTGKTNYLSKA